MNILSVSHNDLDGVSCQIVLKNIHKNMTRMNINYDKIDEYLDIVSEYCYNQNPSKVYITDLSFTSQQFKELGYITKKFKHINFYFIDHHPFEDEQDLVKQFRSENFKIIISNKHSATKLAFMYLKIDNKDLEQYVEYVNAYDIWLSDTTEFKVGMVYNELLWYYKIQYFWNKFSNNFKLQDKDKKLYKDLMLKKRKLFNKLDESGQIFRLDKQKIFMIFLDEYKSHVTIDYKDYDIYIILSSFGGISVRLKGEKYDDGCFKDRVVKRILDIPNVANAGGHPKAFGVALKDVAVSKQIEFAKQILEILNDERIKI